MWLPPIIPALGRLKTAAGSLPRIPGQPGVHSEFQGSQGYRVRYCIKRNEGREEGRRREEEG